MLMQDESDWLMRQLHAFATGLGYTLSRHKGGTTEVVFPQNQNQPLPHQVELAQLIDRKAYARCRGNSTNIVGGGIGTTATIENVMLRFKQITNEFGKKEIQL